MFIRRADPLHALCTLLTIGLIGACLACPLAAAEPATAAAPVVVERLGDEATQALHKLYDYDKSIPLDGHEMLATLSGDRKSPRTKMFWQRQDAKAARVGNWKWIETPSGEMLFDLASDVGETRDMAQEKPDVLARMRAEFAAWRKEMDAAEPRGPFRDY